MTDPPPPSELAESNQAPTTNNDDAETEEARSHEDMHNQNDFVIRDSFQELLNQNDFVIRDGFPALRLPRRSQQNGKDSASSTSTDGNNDHKKPVNDVAATPASTSGPWIDGDEPIPKFDFWGREGCFEFPTTKLLDTLREDCRTVFSARARDDNAAYSAGETYFLPCQMKPRCALEAMVQTIFREHTACLEEGVMIPEQSGAEWWTLVLETDMEGEKGENGASKKQMDSNGKSRSAEAYQGDEDDDEDDEDEVGMHFDADYGLEEQSPNLLLHPRLATVTYLTNSGAPTVVLDRRSPPQSDPQKTTLHGSVKRAWISHPQIGKHIAFDGRLLHGAPATFFPPMDDKENKGDFTRYKTCCDDEKEPEMKRLKPTTEQYCSQRITLLVNVWVNHCPLDAEILDDEVCQKLSTAPDPTTATTNSAASANGPCTFRWTNPDLQAPITDMTTVSLEPSKDGDPAGEEEVLICNRMISLKYNMSMSDLHNATRSGSMLLLNLADNALSLEVGAEVQEEDENDDDENENDED
ncbi:hypothetical protein ACA910_021722 [Epithemia clementina (nom. ined.)]